MSPQFSRAEIVERLERLWTKLEDEGWHVNANTIALAIEALTPKDRKRDRHKPGYQKARRERLKASAAKITNTEA